MNGKFIAYYRVSTKRQGASGLGLEAQREAVQQYLNGGAWDLVGEYTDIESGKNDDRPELAKAIAAAKRAQARLLIAKLDRLSRKLSFVASLMESGVRFVACDNPEANELTIHILAAVAQAERKAISERTRAALAAAKARGVKLGNPELAKARRKAHATLRKSSETFAANVLPVIDQIRATGLTSLRQIAGALNARGIKTRRGAEWTAASVSRILARKRQLPDWS